MKKEMHDNIIQGKINSLQEIPAGISFNAAKSWQQLEKQLQPKQKKNIIWFYAAAILIAAMLISGLIYYNNNSSTSIKKETVLKGHSSQTGNTKSVVLKNDKAKKQSKKASIFIPHQKPISIDKTIIVEDKIKLDSVVIIETALQNNSIAINQPTEAKPLVEKTTTKNVPAKSKFKIVHLNELNTPQPQIITLSKKAGLEEIMYKTGSSNPETETRNNIKLFQLQRNQNDAPVSITDNP
jgi:hypothetical protein